MNRIVIASIVALLAVPATAKTTAENAARLGATLTPVGAEKAANADGSIPEWTGGMTQLGPMFNGHKPGDYYPDPFPEDKPLYKVTNANWKQYKDKLPAGSAKLLEKYADHSLSVYPTRRTAVYPDSIYAATAANATSASLVGEDGLKDAKLGFPFPVPQSGAEVVWNHKVRYRGDSVILNGALFVVDTKGRFQRNEFLQQVEFNYANVRKPGSVADNINLKLLRKEVSPPRLAGNMTLIHEKLDGSRDAWQYNPGANRIRQAPIVAFDNPIAGADGLQNVDQADMFNGSMSRYSWKLVGKKEMIIGYNAYRMVRPEVKYADIIQPRHLNPMYPRYELHRVWVVEATLKPGQGNVFKKRVMYLDEDSWTLAAVDLYDTRDQLWRYQEGFILPLVIDKSVVAAPSITYDLSSGRYVINNLPNEQGFIAKFGATFPQGFFTPQNLQKLGRN
ncbi:MAG TPA: DUF1329 domain-containing protein [Verrucomicrobiae bacterium]|nr:DUF1329 domain-containing protein [Verrucomicrobiae bacterium]